jgi:glycosyltransferase involved in cell wall biosynthesis
VIHVGNYMVRAGIESWLKALVRYTDPRRLRFERCVVTSPLSDPRVIREMPVPVEVGQQASVRRAAQDCDVLLVSGPAEVAEWLGPVRPPLCIFVAHGDGMWSRNILHRNAPAIDHVIAVSQSAQRQVCNGFPSTVIYNGLDTAHLTRSAPRDEVRRRFGLKPDDFVLGSVMRLSSEKHPELLIEAIARLPQRYKLLLVGWGSLRHKLLDLANEIAPLRCLIVGAEDHLGDFYSAFDAFCLPSDTEGFGLATLEALFCGVPAITTKTGFAPELLTDRVHYIQCTGDAESIAAAVTAVADHPQWAACLATEGRRAAERFGFATRMCREYEDVLTSLWQQRRPREERV